MANIKVKLKPQQGIKVKNSNKYIWDPDIAQEFISLTEEYKNEAETSATNAKESETNAKTSEVNAKTSETNAKASETNAKTSEINASVSQINAGTSEINAKSYATNAKTSASEAKESAENAKTSETNAKTSETNAKTSETNSKTSETNAKASETSAMNYADDAMDYASQAETSATASEESKDASVSAKNEATAQATIATNASNNAVSQANIATSKAGEAETYANNAKTSEENAKTSEENAKTSEDNAEDYKARCEEILERLGTAIKIKGRVDTIEDLPTSGNLDGDAYLVGEEGLTSYPEYYWYLNHWEFLGTSGGGGTWGTITGTLANQTDLQNALDSKYDASNPSGYVTSAYHDSTKQDTISDLDTIRSGAELGATSIQPNDNITELNNNAGYITGITSSDVTTALGYTPYNSTNPSGYITSAYHDSTKQDTISDLATIRNGASLGATAVQNTDDCVHLTGDETITGTKTFSSISYSTTPTEDTTSSTQIDTVGARNTKINSVLATLYPVGAIYIGTQSTCPLATLISGSTWELVGAGKVLQGADSSHSANSTINAGLPNITASITSDQAPNAYYGGSTEGAFALKETRTAYVSSGNASTRNCGLNFNASWSNSIYGNSTTVQPPAYVVNIWRRTA